MEGPDNNNRPEIPLVETGTTEDGNRTASASQRSMELQAATAALSGRLDAALFEVGGVRVGAFVGGEVFVGVGQVKTSCGDALVLDGSDVIMVPDGSGGYTAQVPVSNSCPGSRLSTLVGWSTYAGLKFSIPGLLDVD